MKIKYFIICLISFALFIGLTNCKKDNNEVTGIGLDRETVSISVGVSTTVIPFPIPWDAEVEDSFTWASENTGIATVDDSGVILGVAAGETDVVCSYDSFSATVHVTVN